MLGVKQSGEVYSLCQTKLYGGGDDFELAKQFAYLAQSILIDFNFTSYIAQLFQLEQIENHIHTCLVINFYFKSLIMVAALELILSEATYVMIRLHIQ